MTHSNEQKHTYSWIDKLNSLLTPAQIYILVQKTVPELKRGQASLQQLLDDKQLKAAADQAHQLKSTISLLSAESLVLSLDLIESDNSGEVVVSPKFRESLSIQCQQLSDSLEHYLEHSSS